MVENDVNNGNPKVEIECPLWEICTDQWRYYSNQDCPMIILIKNGDVSPIAIDHIRKEIADYLNSSGK